ncbi:MAG: molybdopterin-dependent oxidoreductase [Alphaproteobacteria bacterium]|nr:molybdopterin-dependent oxidoreductase [Alphaproteobacteria bacterium]
MNEQRNPSSHYTATHWGAYHPERDGEGRLHLRPVPDDPDPSAIGCSLADAVDDHLRIEQPMVRAGWLDNGPGPCGDGGATRGSEPFVPVSWDKAFELVTGEIERVRRDHGNRAIYAGSYGWASAGRFHNSKAQLSRFLNLTGGFTRSVNTYSLAAAEVILPHIAGNMVKLQMAHHPWPAVAADTELFVSFGGVPLKNAQVDSGGVAQHSAAAGLRACAKAGVEFINIGPVRSDAADFLDAEWIQPQPSTDVALMLGLAHTLISENLHDPDFMAKYCVGFERFLPYLMGESDGQAKDADWAAAIVDLPAEQIRGLARRMAAKRTLINVAWSLQRTEHGEQPYWMVVALAAVLGQIGLPGGGFGLGYGAAAPVGRHMPAAPWATLSTGRNNIPDFIPVARISDLLLNPGGSFNYNGQAMTYPDIRMVYWVGGNPFHHHQDLNRLLTAWQRPDTVVVHEPWWNATARHADIVLPATTVLERNDIAGSFRDGTTLLANRKVMEPVGQSRHDHDIFRGMAKKMGFLDAFTEGREEMDWLRHIYDLSRQRAAKGGHEMPDFDDFWQAGRVDLSPPEEASTFLAGFRADPVAEPLSTPTGKLEIWSDTIADFSYDDCPGHPVWFEPKEWLGAELAKTYPLHLVSNQPVTRLHSQLDNGIVSRQSKVAGREAATLHPDDAARRGIKNGDVVRLFNSRGQCLAGAVISDAVRPGTVQLPTGAWYDPAEPGQIGSLDKHGNANVLTRDAGTSSLAQGPSAHSCLVEVEAYRGTPPPVTAFTPPPIRTD